MPQRAIFRSSIPMTPRQAHPVDGELSATLALLAAVLVIGLATVGDYGITIDEFVFDIYGPKALVWYASGFTDRAWFDSLHERPYARSLQGVHAGLQSTNLA